MQTSTPEQIRATVKEAYGAIATQTQQTGCCGGGASCCGPAGSSSRQLGYTDADLAAVPDGADLGLGCGNPQAIAGLQPGERALDLGSGAGFDVFLAARQVGETGRVIGVDMTPAMIERARANAAKIGADHVHVEFRLGEIEQLPVDDGSIDVIMSNCVINLAPDKPAVFREAFRVLAPGGRLAISDVVAIADLPTAIAGDSAAYTGCITGAASVAELERMIAGAGFTDVRVVVQAQSRTFIDEWSPGTGAGQFVASALIEAVKPVDVARSRNGNSEPCCDSVLLSTCCPPESKTACCEASSQGGACGCQADGVATR
jgi:arsenite methyltransferase